MSYFVKQHSLVPPSQPSLFGEARLPSLGKSTKKLTIHLLIIIFIGALLSTLLVDDAHAARKRKRAKFANPSISRTISDSKSVKKRHIARSHNVRRYPPQQPDISSALIVDGKTGAVLYAEDATEPRYPASLTKMMTLYLAFESLSQKKLKINQQMYVSAHAASMPQTNLALRAGSYLPVETAIKALVVRSANDAAVVFGETLAGSEAAFADMMTRKAAQLGMKDTTFKNASGLPNRAQKTTARDLAVLAMALNRHFPKYYSYFKTTEFAYNGKTYKTHNRVLLKYPGCDGLKTGFINASGFNLVSSVHRNGRHLIGVVMGGSSGASRDADMMKLFDRAFGIKGAPLSAATSTAPVTPTVALNSAPQLATPPAIRRELAATAAAKSPASAQIKRTQIASGGGQLALAKPNAPSLQASDAPSVGASTLAAAIARPSQRVADNGWGIQVGAYDNAAQAASAAEVARTKLPQTIAQNAIAFPQASSGVYRARLKGLNEEQARNACRSLVQQNAACFVVQVN